MPTLPNVAEWFDNNYLTLHTSKSKFVLFAGVKLVCEGGVKVLSLSYITKTLNVKI